MKISCTIECFFLVLCTLFFAFKKFSKKTELLYISSFHKFYKNTFFLIFQDKIGLIFPEARKNVCEILYFFSVPVLFTFFPVSNVSLKMMGCFVLTMSKWHSEMKCFWNATVEHIYIFCICVRMCTVGNTRGVWGTSIFLVRGPGAPIKQLVHPDPKKLGFRTTLSVHCSLCVL